MTKKGRPPKKQKKLKGGPPRKPSAYNRHVARMMKGGKATMKQAAAAWSKRKGAPKSSRPTSTRASPIRGAAPRRRAPVKGGTKKVAKFNTQKIMKLIRLAALAAPAVGEAVGSAPPAEKVARAIAWYTGYYNGEFDWTRLQRGWGPYAASILVTYGIPKLAGIIRGL